MLKDLNKLALEAKSKRDLFRNTEIRLSEDFKTLYRKKFPASKLEFKEYTSIEYTPKGLAIVIPNQWFLIASFFTEFLDSLFEYKKIVDELGFTADMIKNIRNNKRIDDEQIEMIEEILVEKSDQDLFIKFLTDYEWWFGSKTIDRGDFFVSPILNLASVVHITQGHIAALTETLYSNSELVELLRYHTEDGAEGMVKDVKEDFAIWMTKNTNSNYFNNDVAKTIEGLGLYQKRYEDEFKTDLFKIDFSKIDESIYQIKSNIWNENSSFWKYSESKSTHQPRAILGAENYLRFLKEFQSHSFNNGEVIKGYNKIFFGAPGTGKSYSIYELLERNKVSEDQIERVTFHPDFDYNAFVGGYKPVSETVEDDEKKEVVKYKFVPQIFTNIYVKAHQNPNRNYYLIIEEINRGNCAEIFGDIFQLLDRNPNYKISPSEDLMKYLEREDSSAKNKCLINGKMLMPDNLIILATMNTSDQSLYPMDSAFKRRWDWQYVPIKHPKDENDRSCLSFNFQIKIDGDSYVNWIDFVSSINNHIVRNPSLGMDKCLGNFFIKPLDGITIEFEDFVHKVMFYLWNDVFKDEENEIFQEQTYLDYFPIESNGVANFAKLTEKLKVNIKTYEAPVLTEMETTAADDNL